MKTLMDEANLPYEKREMTYNSRLAQELGKWADTLPGGEAIHDELFRAFFVELLNIGDSSTLIGIAEKVGLDPRQAEEVLQDRTFEQAVNEDWKLAASQGITGVPTFFSNDLFVVGCQPLDVLGRFVSHLQSLQEEDSA